MATVLCDSRVCPFCSTCFSRVDGARRHAKRCIKRDGRALPKRKRGRRRRACEECSRVKVHCTARIEGPCERCFSRKFSCSSVRSQAGVTTLSHSRNRLSRDCDIYYGQTALSFLLEFTDEKQDFITERAVGSEPDGPLLGPTSRSLARGDALRDDILDFMDPSILLLFEYGPLDLDDQLDTIPDCTGNEAYLSPNVPQESDDHQLSLRLEALIKDLTAYAEGTVYHQSRLDLAALCQFCTISNVRTFVEAFCRKRHYHYQIIHWASFSIEEAALPLLLVIVLTGAAYTFGQHDRTQLAVTARAFYDLADSYVFHRLEILFNPTSDSIDIEESIQICQAALLMYALDILPRDKQALQRVAVTQRLPMLILALRRLDFIQVCHDPVEEWQVFIHREQIIRVVAWAYCADCLATLSCNKTPGFSLPEMVGDLPCEVAIWEADPKPPLERYERPQVSTPRCLKEVMSRLHGSDRHTSLEGPELPIFHLHMALCGIECTD